MYLLYYTKGDFWQELQKLLEYSSKEFLTEMESYP